MCVDYIGRYETGYRGVFDFDISCAISTYLGWISLTAQVHLRIRMHIAFFPIKISYVAEFVKNVKKYLLVTHTFNFSYVSWLIIWICFLLLSHIVHLTKSMIYSKIWFSTTLYLQLIYVRNDSAEQQNSNIHTNSDVINNIIIIYSYCHFYFYCARAYYR